MSERIETLEREAGWIPQNNQLNSEIEQVVFSGIVTVRDRLLQMPNPLRLESGDPSFDTPEHIKEAAIRALRDNRTHYAPSNGIKPLREAIVRKLNERNKITNITSPEQVIVTAGGMHALYVTARSLLNSGDEVLLPQPNWTSTNWIIRLAGGVPIRVKLHRDREFRWDIGELESKITPRTKAVLIISPHNPTGGMLDKEDLLDLLEVAERHGLYLVADEAYEDIVFDGEQHNLAALASQFPPGVQQRVISCFTFSKSYAMTGWRLGYIASCNDAFNDHTKKMVLYTANGISTPTQYAGVAALEGPQDCIGKMVAIYRERRDLLYNGLQQARFMRCDFPPRGAIYLYAAITDQWAGSDWELVNYLVDQYSLGAVPGEEFGDEEKSIRFCYACSTEMIQKAVVALAGR